MKYRSDFVTNSSSSSFLIVGIDDDSIINQILEINGYHIPSWEECDDCTQSKGCYGRNECKKHKIPDTYFETEIDGIAILGSSGNADYAGIYIEGLMETMTLPEIRKHFQTLVKENCNINVPIDSIDLHFGEISSE